MKILAISSYGGLGGSQIAMSVFLAHRPAGVEAVAVVIGAGGLPQRLADAGVPTWQAVRLDGRPAIRDLVRFGRGLDAVIARERPDAIWAVGLKAAIMALPAARRRRVPVVWWKVDFSLDETVTRPLSAAVDGVISVSRAAAGAMGRRLERRKLLGVVGPPVALPEDLRTRADPGGQVVGTLGTLMPIKGHHHLIRAAAHLVGEFSELELRIAGGPAPEFPGYGEELADLARELGLADRVKLLGFVDAAPFLQTLNVYVNATCRAGAYGFEGLSGAMLEASWAGLPVVATRGGGTPEGVIDGVTATLVEPDDPAALAEAIATYLRDPSAAVGAGHAGRDFVRERFAPGTAARAMFGLISEVAR